MLESQKVVHKREGPRALLAAVLWQAHKDIELGETAEVRREARAFFGSLTYRRYLSLLGLDPNMMPEGWRWKHESRKPS